MSRFTEHLRQSFRKSDIQRDRGLEFPKNLRTFNNIYYGKERDQVLDLYLPESGKGPYPVLVNIHGGGWVYGDKELYRYFCAELAKQGFAVINFTYRLAPEHKFPAQLIDVNKVVYWILDHAVRYDLDTNNLFMLGDSAGAQLLGLYCDLCTNKDYSDYFKFSSPVGFIPKAVAFNCGSFEPRISFNDTEAQINYEVMRELLPFQGTETELKLVSVVENMTSSFPPSLLVTASNDFLKNQSLLMSKKLLNQNTSFELLFYGDEKERLDHVFNLNIRTEAAAKCNKAICEYFKRAIS